MFCFRKRLFKDSGKSALYNGIMALLSLPNPILNLSSKFYNDPQFCLSPFPPQLHFNSFIYLVFNLNQHKTKQSPSTSFTLQQSLLTPLLFWNIALFYSLHVHSITGSAQSNEQCGFVCRFKRRRNIPKFVKTNRSPKWIKISPVEGMTHI